MPRHANQAEAIQYLLSVCSVGTTIYAVPIHYSRSGQLKVFRFYVIRPLNDDNTDHYLKGITGSVCDALGFKWNDKHEGLGSRNWSGDIVELLSDKLHGDSSSLKHEHL